MARHLPASTHIRATGFTLIELMITLVIAAILLAVAVPNFSDIIKKNRVEGIIRELSGALALARTEAASRGGTVTLCRTANPDAVPPALPICVPAGETPDPTDGWAIFEDTNNDGVLDGSETVLRVRGNLTTTRLSMADDASTTLRRVQFNRHGFSNLRATFTACDDTSDEQYSRALLMGNTGSVTLASSNSAGVAQDIDGDPVICP